MTQINSTKTEKKTRKPRVVTKTYTRKNTSMTFWNQLRVENNYNLKDLSDVLGVTPGRLSAVFTGMKMPSRTFSDRCCELFGVDPIEGWKQFEIGYDVYHNTHGKSVTVEPRVVNPVIKADVKKYVNQSSTTVEPVIDHQVDIPKQFRPADRSMDDLLITLMGAMQPADFVELVHKVDERSVDWSNVFDRVYGKIDVKTFIKLVRLKNG